MLSLLLSPRSRHLLGASAGALALLAIGCGASQSTPSNDGSGSVSHTPSSPEYDAGTPVDAGPRPAIVTSGYAARAIAMDATSIYFTNDADLDGKYQILKMPRAGGNPTELASGDGLPMGIAVDSANVYWTDYKSETVMRVSRFGGTPTTIASGQSSAMGIAIDAANVYWTTQGGTSPSTGTVMSTPIAGGPVTPIATGRDQPCSIVVTATAVLWAESHAVMTAPLGGGDAKPLAANRPIDSSESRLFALDGKRIYWAEADAIMSMPLAGGSMTKLAASSGGRGLVVDKTNVYWGTTGQIMSAPLAGGTATELASRADFDSDVNAAVGELALDGANVYRTFMDRTNGGVAKLPLR
jgi:hypothetical protein